ncbi:MAG TPA: hypothetical protein VM123_04670 [archaeon]|nr:hypothetical protein [archaeon]
MLIHTDHLVPNMKLEKDIELKAGSYLITCKELGDGSLTEKVIESVRKFSAQIVPESHKIQIQDDEIALRYIKQILDEDLKRIAEGVISGKACPNFLADKELQEKVMRVMEMLFSNPDIIRLMYDARFNSGGKNSPLDLIIDHSIRTALLSVALGLRVRWTIIALVSIGMAALLHDMGILSTSIFPNLDSLDDLTSRQLADFVYRHQLESAVLFNKWQENMTPYQRGEVFHILGNHHFPDFEDKTNKNTLLFHFADLLDEMISHLPHRVRYNFTPAQLKILGERYSRRTGLVTVLLGLNRLYKNQSGLAWEIISNLAGLFKMEQLLSGDYEKKLKEILDFCPFDSAKVNPPLDGNTLPWAVYCSKSLEKGFSCEHMVHSKVEIQTGGGRMIDYHKCGTLGKRLEELNKQDKK